jgi:hypothetical protein
MRNTSWFSYTRDNLYDVGISEHHKQQPVGIGDGLLLGDVIRTLGERNSSGSIS